MEASNPITEEMRSINGIMDNIITTILKTNYTEGNTLHQDGSAS